MPCTLMPYGNSQLIDLQVPFFDCLEVGVIITHCIDHTHEMVNTLDEVEMKLDTLLVVIL